jgi:Domain of unknown function (DUF4136)
VIRALNVLCFALLLGACAAPVMRNDVTAFHQWPAQVTARSYQLIRLPGQEASLEHATYEGVLRTELAAAGFRETPSPSFVVAIEYVVENRLQRVYEYPPWGAPGVFGSIGGFRGGWGWSVGVPIGVPIFPPMPRDFSISNRTVKLVVSQAPPAGGARLWEGTAVSSGTAPGLTEVLPYMLRALLSDFPGVNGLTRRVEVELPKR